MYLKPQTLKKILFGIFLCFIVVNSFSQEIGVTGNSNNIEDNSTNSPQISNFTDFDTATSRTFYVENIQGTGSTTLTISSITLSNTTDFTISSPLGDTTLGKNQSSPFTISLNGSVCGTFTSTVTITHDGTNDNTAPTNQWIFTISATKAPEINILNGATTIANAATDNPSEFLNIDVGSSSTAVTYTIQNTGNCVLDLNGSPDLITLSNSADYSVDFSSTSSTIAAGGSTTFTVTFNPTVGGAPFTTVTIPNTDADEDPYVFTINGTSIAPLTEGPGGVTNNLQLWLKANEGIIVNGSSGVTTWATQARGSNATVHTTGQEPTFRDDAAYNVNFNPVVDFDNSYNPVPKDSDYSYDDVTTQFLEGSEGFYTEEIFMVVIPDVNVNNSFGSMDLFCGDEDLANDEEDATGIGYGSYSIRFEDEVISYAIGTTNEDGTGGTENGYGVAETGGGSYANVGIINTRNNSANSQQELYYNAVDIEDTQNEIGDFSNVNNSRFWIGRSEGWEASTDARIAEIITYSSRKNDASLTDERNKIQSYLAIKYGITLGSNGTSQDYVDSAANVIWDQSANAGFNYDIAGIGRDDDSALNQKQSKSVNSDFDVVGQIRGLVTMSLTDIYNTNTENINNNATTFNDKEYLTWGNNNGNLDNAPNVVTVNMSAGITPALTTDVSFTGMERVWKVVEHGGDIPKVKVSIPKNAVRNISPPGSYLMFISDTGVFDPTADYRVMTESGGNLYADYDFDGTKYITFGYAPETKVVRSIYFDGVQDYVDMEDALNLNASEFTISAWIKRDPTSVNASIISKRDAGFNEGYGFEINASGELEMSWINGTKQTITSNTVIPGNVWHQVAVIYDSGVASLYIDGVLDNTASLSAPVASTQSFYIAAAGKLTHQSFFKGNIDEVRVWDVALTVDQLRYIMNQEIIDSSVSSLPLIQGNIIPTSITKNEISSIPWSNLAGYYPMSVYTYTNTNDMSGNGHQGALRNLDTVDRQTAPLPYESTATGNWDTATTWLNNTVQDLPNTNSIVDGTTPIDWNIVETNHNINTTRNVTVLGLKNNINELSVNADNSLTVTHYLLINGVLDLDNESQLIQTTGSDLDDGSTGHLERDQQGEGNKYRYNDWSSPVYTATDGNGNYTTILAALRDGTNASAPGAINYVSGYDGSLSPLTLSTYWMYKYANLPDDSYSSWDHIGNTGTVYAGEGFLMKGSGDPGSPDQNYVFEGKPNNGAINLTISAGYDYLIGNPYPSAIDAYKFIDDNPDITGPLYFWDHYGGDTHNLAGYQAGYATLTKSGGVYAAAHPSVSNLGAATKIPEQYIPVSQGFFVYSNTGGTIHFNNAQRIFVKESSGTSLFMKTAKGKSTKTTKTKEPELDTRPKFRIGFNAPKIDHRQLLLTIDKNTTDGFDRGYDGEIYEIFGDDMYWMIGDKKYVIQATNTISSDSEIPLGIQLSESGKISINVDDLENVDENTKLYVKDSLTGETYNIKNQPFEMNLEAGDYVDRFVLVFQPKLLSVNEVSLNEGIRVIVGQQNSEIKVIKIVDTEIIDISLYNYLGQVITTWNTGLSKRQIFLPTHTSSGVYILKINTKDGSISKKIIIN